MAKEKEILLGYLKTEKMKMTSQREKILDFFLKWKTHLTSEEMFHKLRSKYPHLGRATVYRTLKLLEQSNLVDTVELGDGFRRFELKHNDAHHDHLVCTRCGAVVEFYNKRIEVLKRKITTEHGYTYQNHMLKIYGLCKKCQK